MFAIFPVATNAFISSLNRDASPVTWIPVLLYLGRDLNSERGKKGFLLLGYFANHNSVARLFKAFNNI